MHRKSLWIIVSAKRKALDVFEKSNNGIINVVFFSLYLHSLSFLCMRSCQSVAWPSRASCEGLIEFFILSLTDHSKSHLCSSRDEDEEKEQPGAMTAVPART